MNIHKNARLTRHGRARIVDLARGGQTPNAIANLLGVCPRTVRKWLKRYHDEGAAGLLDRSSRPRLPSSGGKHSPGAPRRWRGTCQENFVRATS
jgi:transposase-like protein